MASHIKIRKADGIWTVRAGGAVLGESANAIELVEGSGGPVIYFPRADIAMAFLDESESCTQCPHKGQAHHFSIVTKSRTLENAVWSYETPKEAVAQIKDHLAFYDMDEITIERI